MQNLNQAASRVLDALTANLRIGASRHVDNAPGVYMRVCVERLSEHQYSIAHYYEQNGDLVCDPDGVFFKAKTGQWLPVSLQLCTGHFTEALILNANDEPAQVRPRAQKELASFAAMWMRNIADQQGGVARIIAAQDKIFA